MESQHDVLPKADLIETESFEAKRSCYFAEEYAKTSLYWSSLRDLMGENDGSTQAVIVFFGGKLEVDRGHTSGVYANADRIFGDRKGQAKLRHDKIRQAELKSKQKGEEVVLEESITKPGGGVHPEPANSTLRALWELAEMECRAARCLDTLCDELEQDNLLGKVKSMGKETHRRFKELSDEGDACLVSLRNVDKRVGESFLRLREILGNQIGGKVDTEDIWLLDSRYRTAVVHQKEAWKAVTTKLRDVFARMKELEAQRRETLRSFLVEANAAIGDCWDTLPTLCKASSESANALDASQASVDAEVTVMAARGAEEKLKVASQHHLLPNTSGIQYAEPVPEDTSFIESVTATLESPLIRTIMMVERREPKGIGGSKYIPGLMVLSWDGYLHFFDIPDTSNLKADASPAAAFQELTPTVSLDELLLGKKDLDDILMFDTTITLQLEEDSTVEPVISHKSHKIEVKGICKHKSVLKHLGSGSRMKMVTFRTPTEAEMTEAVQNIKGCIQTKGGMGDKADSGYPIQHDPHKPSSARGSLESDRASMEGERTESGYTRQSYKHVNPEYMAPPGMIPRIAPAFDQAAMIVPMTPGPFQPQPQPMAVPFLANPGWIPTPTPTPTPTPASFSLVPPPSSQFGSNPGTAAFASPPSQEPQAAPAATTTAAAAPAPAPAPAAEEPKAA